MSLDDTLEFNLSRTLDITGHVWGDAHKRYKETSWFNLFKKLKRRRAAIIRETAFFLAIENYEKYLEMKRS